jgi:FlaA1/EpsC-like NDP-sugar epimerase
LVLDVGSPFRVSDVASRLASASDRRIEIVTTGLRGGEKLHEVLLAPDESDLRPVHPLISHVTVPALNPDRAWSINLHVAQGELTASLRQLSYEGALRLPADG